MISYIKSWTKFSLIHGAFSCLFKIIDDTYLFPEKSEKMAKSVKSSKTASKSSKKSAKKQKGKTKLRNHEKGKNTAWYVRYSNNETSSNLGSRGIYFNYFGLMH